MASDVKKPKKGATVKDVLVPGQGGAHMIDLLTQSLKDALGMPKPKDDKKKKD
jgi:hypothetical protein